MHSEHDWLEFCLWIVCFSAGSRTRPLCVPCECSIKPQLQSSGDFPQQSPEHGFMETLPFHCPVLRCIQHTQLHAFEQVMFGVHFTSEQCGMSALMRLLAPLICHGKAYLIRGLIGLITWEKQRNAQRESSQFLLIP